MRVLRQLTVGTDGAGVGYANSTVITTAVYGGEWDTPASGRKAVLAGAEAVGAKAAYSALAVLQCGLCRR